MATTWEELTERLSKVKTTTRQQYIDTCRRAQKLLDLPEDQFHFQQLMDRREELLARYRATLKLSSIRTKITHLSKCFQAVGFPMEEYKWFANQLKEEAASLETSGSVGVSASASAPSVCPPPPPTMGASASYDTGASGAAGAAGGGEGLPTLNLSWEQVVHALQTHSGRHRELSDTTLKIYLRNYQSDLPNAYGVDASQFWGEEIRKNPNQLLEYLHSKFAESTVRSRIGSYLTLFKDLNVEESLLGSLQLTTTKLTSRHGSKSIEEKPLKGWEEFLADLAELAQVPGCEPAGILYQQGYVLRPAELFHTQIVPHPSDNFLNLSTGEWQLKRSEHPRTIQLDRPTLDRLAPYLCSGRTTLTTAKTEAELATLIQTQLKAPLVEIRNSFLRWFQTRTSSAAEIWSHCQTIGQNCRVVVLEEEM